MESTVSEWISANVGMLEGFDINMNCREQLTRKYMEEESKSTYTTFVLTVSFPNGFNVVLHQSTFLQQIQHLEKLVLSGSVVRHL